MHALLAHAYHLALLPIHMGLRPGWRPFAACLAVAALARLSGLAGARGGALAAGGSVLAGWWVLAPALAWPLPPVARLSGLAGIVLAGALSRGGRFRLPLSAALAAWWLRGVPLDGAAIARSLPVFLGLAAASALARRLARADRSWGTVAASVSLAAGLAVAGAAPHWSMAALVVAAAVLCLPGACALVLADMVVMAGASALVASDRGRLVTVDTACLGPLLAWMLVPRLAPGLGRYGPIVAAALTVLLCMALTWAARFL